MGRGRIGSWCMSAALAILICVQASNAQEHAHGALPAERLGSVHFPTSCHADSAQFDRGVALLHSFEFGASIRAFNDVLAMDSTCAIAHWGIALSRWGNPMAAVNRTPTALLPGRQAANAATRLGSNATTRERGYIDAVAQLYADYEHRSQPTRVAAYEKAMADLVAQQPTDTEAKVFHAIALVASASPADKTYARQLAAGAILEGIWALKPDHPGLAHYIIHAYDAPPLAGRARNAAARYAQIAPSAAHALHMPSHTFTRVGMWRESINTNLRSIAEASHSGALGEALHASDYTTYAYLQLRNDSAAKAIVDGLPAIAARFDLNAVTGAAPAAAGVFALAAIPARYALERRDWTRAAALPAATTAFPYADAQTHFARALGAAHTGAVPAARASLDSLTAIGSRLAAQKEDYWVEQVAIARLGAEAWLAFTQGQRDDGVAKMREATAREDATEKSAITPGPLAPARELLGDMLMEMGRPADALAEYQRTLAKEPNRYRSMYGAMSAAKAAGDPDTERKYASAIAAMTR